MGEFIAKQPHEKYLVTKVRNTKDNIKWLTTLFSLMMAVIMGIKASCRSQVLHAIEDMDWAVLLNSSKEAILEFYICKKYESSRVINTVLIVFLEFTR